MKKVFIILIFSVGLFLSALIVGAFLIQPTTFKLNHAGGWSVALVELDSNESASEVYSKCENGQLTWVNQIKVQTNDSVLFLADPFLISHNDSIYLFVETQIAGRGAYITCFYIPQNNLEPQYLGIALHEPFHLSYPQVIELGGQYIMIPESQRGDSSFIYVCEKMPLQWKRIGFIYPGRIKDPTLLPVNDTVGYLYYGLEGKLFKQNYTFQYPSFHLGPVEYQKTGTCFRPGGKPIFIDNKYHLLLQDNSAGYGTGLYAFELLNDGNINQEQMGRKLLGPSAIHSPFKAGMHHMCLLPLKNGKKLVAIDGNKLIKEGQYFDLMFFLKYSYLKLWDIVFGNNKAPYYPFNE